MKKIFFYFVALVLLVSISGIYAQTKTIAVHVGGDGTSNQLKSVIDSDSTYKGTTTYVLDRGGIYMITGNILTKHAMTITSAATPADQRPAVLMLATDAQGKSPGFMFQQLATNLTFDNLYIIGMDDLKNRGDFVRVQLPKMKLTVQNCSFQHVSTFRGVLFYGSIDGTIVIKDNVFWNITKGDGFTWGRVLYCNGSKIDTCIFTNNTVFGNAARVMDFGNNSAKEPNWLLVDHNTFVNVGLDLSHSRWYMNTVKSNNIQFNVLMLGDAVHTASVGRGDNGDGNSTDNTKSMPWCFFQQDTLLSTGTNLGNGYPKKTYDSLLAAIKIPYPIVKVYNNDYFQSAEVLANFKLLGKDPISGSDSILVPQILNARALSLFNKTENPGLFYDTKTNWQLDPGFKKNPTNYANLTKFFLYKQRGATKAAVGDFLIDPDNDLYTFEWPLRGTQFDFSYTNTTLKGSDGLHLGDLNWYPSERATYVYKPVSVQKVNNEIPAAYTLSQNYPNPFNPTTFITFSLPKNGMTTLKVYNVLGQEVAELVNQELTAGKHVADFNASKLSSGVYFYTLHSGDFTQTMKMMLLK